MALLLSFCFALWQVELLPSCGLPGWKRDSAVRRYWRWLVLPYGRDPVFHPRLHYSVRLGSLVLALLGVAAWWGSVLGYVLKSNLHP